MSSTRIYATTSTFMLTMCVEPFLFFRLKKNDPTLQRLIFQKSLLPESSSMWTMVRFREIFVYLSLIIF